MSQVRILPRVPALIVVEQVLSTISPLVPHSSGRGRTSGCRFETRSRSTLSVAPAHGVESGMDKQDPTPPERMNAVLAHARPEHLPAWFNGVSIFVHAGLVRPDEADEWRRRIAAWRAFHDADPAGGTE